MIVKSESYSNRGEKCSGRPVKMNEDRTVAAHNTFAVIDGATDRFGHNINNMTPGAYVADYVHKTLTNLAQHPDYNQSRAELLLAGINRAFGENLQQNRPQLVEQGFTYAPTAATAFLRLHDDGSYSYAVVGDCFLVVFATDGSVHVCPPEEKPSEVEQDRLDYFMTLYKNAQNEGAENTFETLMDDPKAHAMYMDFRENLNKNFSVLNGDPAMENLMLSGHGKTRDVAAFVLMTDGMLMPGLPEPEGAKAAAEKIRADGISAYGQMLEELYNADEARESYPRFKHRDDMAALHLELEHLELEHRE